MLAVLLLASQFCLMSDRTFFWSAERISNRTAFYQNSNPETIALDSKAIEGKSILLLVHGYNNDAAQALSTYQLINLLMVIFLNLRMIVILNTMISLLVIFGQGMILL